MSQENSSNRWICIGVPQNGKQYSNAPNPHEPLENDAPQCQVCGLPREAMLPHKSVASPALRLQLIATVALILALVVLAYLLWLLFESCSSQQKFSGFCLTKIPSQTPTPRPPVTLTPVPFYSTLAQVANVPRMIVKYGGSTSFAPLRSPTIEALIRQAHPGFQLSYKEPSLGQQPGSGAGIAMLLKGQLSFTQSSRPVKNGEFEEAKRRNFRLEQIPVAIDGVAFYIHPQLSIPGLNHPQLKDIFTGKITNWKQIGGSDVKIVPFSRSLQDAGTPEFLQAELLEKQALGSAVQKVRDTTESIRKVAKTPGGIGYATASEVCNQLTIRSLPIAREANQRFVSPCIGNQVNKADFANDTYPVTRRLFVVIKRDGQLDEQAGVAYVNLMLSDEGQQLVNQAGFVAIRSFR